jgi:hypothetical protein
MSDNIFDIYQQFLGEEDSREQLRLLSIVKGKLKEIKGIEEHMSGIMKDKMEVGAVHDFGDGVARVIEVNRNDFDSKRFKEDHPETAKLYEKKSCSKQLKIKLIEEE